MMQAHLRRMARYNAWANTRLYAACLRLPAAVYHAPRPSFFGSIHATLNHLLVADRLWRARIEGASPPYKRLDEAPWAGLDELAQERAAEDALIVARLDRADEAELARDAVYRMVTSPATEMRTSVHVCWLHVFNHQTHHRGQVHDQLSQTEIAPPPLDLVFYLREAG